MVSFPHVRTATPICRPRRSSTPGCAASVRVLGGPGTGKSSLLVEAAAAHIGAGADPESVLLLTGSGRLGTQARACHHAAALLRTGLPRRRA